MLLLCSLLYVAFNLTCFKAIINEKLEISLLNSMYKIIFSHNKCENFFLMTYARIWLNWIVFEKCFEKFKFVKQFGHNDK